MEIELKEMSRKFASKGGKSNTTNINSVNNNEHSNLLGD